MIIVDVTQEKSIDMALRQYKKKIQRTRQIQELQERKSYTKPSVRRRQVILKAKYSNRFRG